MLVTTRAIHRSAILEAAWWADSVSLRSQLQEACSRAADGEIIRLDVRYLDRLGQVHYADLSITPLFGIRLGGITQADSGSGQHHAPAGAPSSRTRDSLHQ